MPNTYGAHCVSHCVRDNDNIIDFLCVRFRVRDEKIKSAPINACTPWPNACLHIRRAHHASLCKQWQRWRAESSACSSHVACGARRDGDEVDRWKSNGGLRRNARRRNAASRTRTILRKTVRRSPPPSHVRRGFSHNKMCRNTAPPRQRKSRNPLNCERCETIIHRTVLPEHARMYADTHETRSNVMITYRKTSRSAFPKRTGPVPDVYTPCALRLLSAHTMIQRVRATLC